MARGELKTVALSADGLVVAAYIHNYKLSELRAWEVGTGKQLYAIRRGMGARIAFSPDGKFLATGICHIEAIHYSPLPIRVVSHGEITVWDARNGQQVASLAARTKVPSFVAFSPKGGRLLTADETGLVQVWDTAKWRVHASFTTGCGAIRSAAFSPDGKRVLVAGATGGTMTSLASGVRMLWKYEGKMATFSLSAPVVFSPDGSRVAVVDGFRAVVRVFEAGTGRQIMTRKGASGIMCFSDDGRTALTAGGIVDAGLADWEQFSVSRGGDRPSYYALSADGRLFANAALRFTTLLNTDTGRAVGRYDIGSDCVAFSPDGAWLAIGSRQTGVTVKDLRRNRSVAVLEGGADGLAFSPDGRGLAIDSSGRSSKQGQGANSAAMSIWDTKTWNRAHSFGPKGAVRGSAMWSPVFSNDAKTLIAGGPDKKVKVYDIDSGRAIRFLTGHSNWIRSVALSPQGRLVATASDDGTVRLWELSTGHPVSELRGHSAGVMCVTFSPDGRRLATAGKDGTVRIWDTSTGHEVLSLSPRLREDESAHMFFVQFSDDGMRLVVKGFTSRGAKYDGFVAVWDAWDWHDVSAARIEKQRRERYRLWRTRRR